jgi:hypothetical protein
MRNSLAFDRSAGENWDDSGQARRACDMRVLVVTALGGLPF